MRIRQAEAASALSVEEKDRMVGGACRAAAARLPLRRRVASESQVREAYECSVSDSEDCEARGCGRSPAATTAADSAAGDATLILGAGLGCGGGCGSGFEEGEGDGGASSVLCLPEPEEPPSL